MNKDDQIEAENLERIFMPHSAENKERLRSIGNRLAHYTSAVNAINILNSKSLWMRSPRCMNDYMEILHGHNQLARFFNTEGHRNRFISAINAYEENLASEILTGLDDWWKKIENDTFIASVSEHRESEDQYGRLSMWRAYGDQSARAALVLNNPPTPSEKLNLILSPAAYLTYEQLEAELLRIIQSVEDHMDYLRTVNRQKILGIAIISLIILAVCLKHPGFKEEQEWRIIYLPKIMPANDWIKGSVENISGVPQMVFKIPLENSSDLNITGLSLPELVNKVIVGPTQYPLALFDAFEATMRRAGIENSADKIQLSDIPLRT